MFSAVSVPPELTLTVAMRLLELPAVRTPGTKVRFIVLVTVRLPPELAPGLHFYSRGLHDKELSEIECVLAQSLWCDGQERGGAKEEAETQGEEGTESNY